MGEDWFSAIPLRVFNYAVKIRVVVGYLTCLIINHILTPLVGQDINYVPDHWDRCTGATCVDQDNTVQTGRALLVILQAVVVQSVAAQ